ncbi:MAG: pimeloyl-ACP methyl ester carboxylesterase [Oleiphilaceae bacterium]|jgi:pimeloyl-ACP methyl ester carboxylesterase
MITILLIRGLSRQQEHWGEFPTILRRAFKEKNIAVNLAFEDLPGFGIRYQQKSPSSIEKIAALLVPTLDRLHKESKQKIHLLGISMGGMVALELARRCPEFCESLVMINSSVKPVAHMFQRLQPQAYSIFIKAFLHPSMRESERQILQISTEKYAQDARLLNYWLYLRENYPPSRKAALQQIVAASRYLAPIKKPLASVCLIASKRDRIASHHCTQNLAEYWGIDYHLHPEAGHDIALDEPEWLADNLVNFVQNMYSISFRTI